MQPHRSELAAFPLSVALDDADNNKLVGAIEDFTQTRAPLFKGIGAA